LFLVCGPANTGFGFHTIALDAESGLSRTDVAKDHSLKQGPHPLYIIYALISFGFSDRCIKQGFVSGCTHGKAPHYKNLNLTVI
jgi:hypothetical protein